MADESVRPTRLVQPDQEYFVGVCLRFMRHVLGPLAVIFQDTDPHPPVAHRTAEAQHLCSFVASGKTVGQFVRIIFILE